MARIFVSLAVIGTLSACGGAATASPTMPGASTAARASTGSAAVAPACGPTLARTLAASPRARIYDASHTVYGCAAPGHRRWRLGTDGVCNATQRIGVAAVSGVAAAYAATSCGVDTGSTEILVRRLDTGATLVSQAAAPVTFPESFTSASAVVVESTGAVAWIGQVTSIVRHSSATAVYAARGSSVRRLDAGPAIGATSLRLRGTTVSWRHGAARRSARL